MTDQLPEFDTTVNSETEPKPARRKAPRRRKVNKVAVRKARRVAPPAPKRKVAKKARRGRPVGSKNKPKIRVAVSVDRPDVGGRIADLRTDVVAFVQHVLGMPVAPWQAEILRKLLKKAD